MTSHGCEEREEEDNGGREGQHVEVEEQEDEGGSGDQDVEVGRNGYKVGEVKTEGIGVMDMWSAVWL